MEENSIAGRTTTNAGGIRRRFLRSVRKWVNTVAGLSIALAAAVFALLPIKPLPYGLDAEAWARRGVWLLLIGAVSAVASFILTLLVFASEEHETLRSSALVTLRSVRFRWPWYLKTSEAAMLLNARIAAQAEAAKQIKAASDQAELHVIATKLEMSQRDREKTQLEEELSGVKHQLAAARDDARRRYELLQFGMESRIGAPTLDDVVQRGVVNSLHELQPSIENLWTTIEAIWSAVQADAARANETATVGWLQAYVREIDWSHVNNAFAELKKVLDRGDDPRGILFAAYVTYRRWRMMTGQLAAACGKQLSELDGYAAWRRAEVVFADKLADKLSLKALREVGDLVRNIEARTTKLADPPPTAPTSGTVKIRLG